MSKLPKGRRYLIRLSDFPEKLIGYRNSWKIYEGDVETIWFHSYNNQGWYELRFTTREITTINLGHYFMNWKNPTKSEVDYFKMVTGCPYLTDLLKLEPLDD